MRFAYSRVTLPHHERGLSRHGHPQWLGLHIFFVAAYIFSTEIFFRKSVPTYICLHIFLKYYIFDPLAYILYVGICRARPCLVFTIGIGYWVLGIGFSNFDYCYWVLGIGFCPLLDIVTCLYHSHLLL